MTDLRDPFDKSMVGTMPKGGVQLSYVGHGAVTSRLLDVDPTWTWEPVAYEPNGLPVFERDGEGNPIGFWIRLTVDGVTRLGYGDCPSKQTSAEKVLIGDALRNAAMRFGVALDLWIKGQSEDDESRVSDGPRNRATNQRPARPSQPQESAGDWRTEYLAAWRKDGLLEDEVCGSASRGARRRLDAFEDGERGALRVAAAKLLAEHRAIKDAAEGTITSPPAQPGEPTSPAEPSPEGVTA